MAEQEYFLSDDWHGRTVAIMNVRSQTTMDLNGGEYLAAK
jgi:hypothetical protein